MFAAARNGGARDHRRCSRARPTRNVTTKVVTLGRVLVDANGDPLLAGRSRAAAARVGVDRSATAGPRVRRHRDGRHDGAALRRARRARGGGARAGRGRRRRQPGVRRREDLADHRGDHQRPSRHRRRSCSTHGADPTLANIDGVDAALRDGRHAVARTTRGTRSRPSPRRRPRYLELHDARCSTRAPTSTPASRASCGSASSATATTGSSRSAPRRSGAPPRPTTWRRCGCWSARGADPSIPTTLGVTPLMVAAGIGFEYQGTNIVPDARLAAVQYLVEELHADVNARDIQDYTPLHGAALRRRQRPDRIWWPRAPIRRRAPRAASAARRAPTTSPRARATRWPTWPTARARIAAAPRDGEAAREPRLGQLARLPIDGLREQHQGRHRRRSRPDSERPSRRRPGAQSTVQGTTVAVGAWSSVAGGARRWTAAPGARVQVHAACRSSGHRGAGRHGRRRGERGSPRGWPAASDAASSAGRPARLPAGAAGRARRAGRFADARLLEDERAGGARSRPSARGRSTSAMTWRSPTCPGASGLEVDRRRPAARPGVLRRDRRRRRRADLHAEPVVPAVPSRAEHRRRARASTSGSVIPGPTGAPLRDDTAIITDHTSAVRGALGRLVRHRAARRAARSRQRRRLEPGRPVVARPRVAPNLTNLVGPRRPARPISRRRATSWR